jgi:hypothetical protein
MKWTQLSAFAAVATGALLGSVSAATSSSGPPPIEIVGNKFFYSNNGSEFYIRGIAYQSDVANETAGQTFSDPLADAASCKRDLPYLQQLLTNVVRVYALNTSLDHTECMQMFGDAGIYVVADLSQPGLSINRDDPQWNVDLYNRYTSVIDEFQNYTNILGFFAGNEVTNNNTNTDASPFVKAAVRDMKAYIKSQNYRQIPMGYSTNDDAATREPMAEYFVCGDDSEKVDFYGINMYEWCGDATFQSSGYAARTAEFANLSVPLFFSEYGCNAVQPRTFTEVSALYSSEMTDVWIGGIVYMYFQEANDYGLVTIEADNSVSTLADFNFLAKELSSVSPTTINSASYTPSSVSIACPASTGLDWKGSDILPPTPNQAVCDCVSDAALCVVSNSVDETDYGALFGYLCGQVSCAGISGNGTSGQYGSYSFCDAKDQLNYVLNLYYEQNNKADSACDFSGSASINKAAVTSSSCAAVLSQAGSAGTGAISATITGKAAQDPSGSASSGSTSASATNKSGDAPSIGGGIQLAAAAFGTILALAVVY